MIPERYARYQKVVTAGSFALKDRRGLWMRALSASVVVSILNRSLWEYLGLKIRLPFLSLKAT